MKLKSRESQSVTPTANRGENYEPGRDRLRILRRAAIGLPIETICGVEQHGESVGESLDRCSRPAHFAQNLSGRYGFHGLEIGLLCLNEPFHQPHGCDEILVDYNGPVQKCVSAAQDFPNDRPVADATRRRCTTYIHQGQAFVSRPSRAHLQLQWRRHSRSWDDNGRGRS